EFNGTEYQGDSFSTNLDLVVSYNATDIDGDQGVDAYDLNLDSDGYALGSEYRWYRNRSGVVSLVSVLNDETTVDSHNTKKGDIWWVQIHPRDFYGQFGDFINSSKIEIGNTAPFLSNFIWLISNPTTSDDLTFQYIDYYRDFDGDPIATSNTLILWYVNNVLVAENTTFLSNSFFNKSDEIYVVVLVHDGYVCAAENYTSSTVIIANSLPEADNVILKPTIINNTEILYLNWSYSDIDNDAENSSWIIVWTRNGATQTGFNNWNYFPLELVTNGDLWIAELRVFDGESYSAIYSTEIYTKVLSVFYDLDASDTSQVDPAIRTDEFCVEDENLIINFYFDSNEDANNSRIQWFKEVVNGEWEEIPEYENEAVIPYSYLNPGDRYYCLITPTDDEYIWGQINSSIIIIESRPVIHTASEDIVVVLEDAEGQYLLTIITNDTRNDIYSVEFTFNDTSLGTLYAQPVAGLTNAWRASLSISPSDFQSYMSVLLSGTVKVACQVNYDSQAFEIYTTDNFNITVEDTIAPRVINAYFIPNSEINPTNITFYVEVQEYGAGVSSVIVYYYFEVAEENQSSMAGLGANVFQTGLPAEMTVWNQTGLSTLYNATVPFYQNETNWRVIYYVSTTDLANNTNPRAYDVRRDDPDLIDRNVIPFSPPGIDPTLVMIIIGIVLFLAFSGSIVYVKFIRKPELVGLDKELVLEGITKIPNVEVMATLDSHTTGVVISFFDQRHGPIPIIVVPEILKDNFSKLVDLSDRSFSGTGFSDDFTIEIPSSYDFVVAQGLRTSVISFGYSLKRPDARGGQENITCNILIHKDLFPLVNQFLNEIQREVHNIHITMDKEPSNKDKIRKEVLELRKYVSSIIISYENIYETTELLTPES
ncbi:MAG: hypothetical protein ACXADY_22540, partial [Candidatus Hodarchaeales archaeon]